MADRIYVKSNSDLAISLVSDDFGFELGTQTIKGLDLLLCRATLQSSPFGAAGLHSPVEQSFELSVLLACVSCAVAGRFGGLFGAFFAPFGIVARKGTGLLVGRLIVWLVRILGQIGSLDWAFSKPAALSV